MRRSLEDKIEIIGWLFVVLFALGLSVGMWIDCRETRSQSQCVEFLFSSKHRLLK